MKLPCATVRLRLSARPAEAVWAVLAPLAFALALGCASGAPAAKTAPSSEPGGSSEADAAEPSAAAEPEESEAARPRGKPMSEVIEELYAEAAEDEVVDREEAAEPEKRKGPPSIDYPQPPDGEWLTDDQGRQYYTVEIPKVEGHYVRMDDGRIQGLRGVVMDLAGETEDTFLIKIYKVEPVEPEEDDTPTEEEIAAVAASYAVELPTADLLEVDGFGRGLPERGQWRNGFDVADMDGDGHLDVVHGTPRRGQGPPVIFLGDGRGGWSLWAEARFPPAPYDYGDVTAADFNRDGHMDLGLAIHLSGLLVLVGDGEGGFEAWSEGLALVRPGVGDRRGGFLSRTVASADWNGDGWPDLLALSEGPRHPKATERGEVETPYGLMVYLNQGDGSWVPGEHLAEKEGIFGDALAIGDFDGDGRPDAVTGSNAIGRRRILHLSGAEDREGRAVDVAALRPRSFVWSADGADFDGDGLRDLVVSTTGLEVGQWWAALDVLLARRGEDGALAYERRPLAGGLDDDEHRVTAVGAGDLDGDGAADVVGATSDGRLLVFVGDGRGGFQRHVPGPLDTPRPGCRGYHVEVVDLGGRKGDEVVAAFAGERCPGGGSIEAWTASRR